MASLRKLTSSDLGARVLARLLSVAPRGARLRLGLSGGRDSVVLFSILCDFAQAGNYTFECMHVHHGISPHADMWAAFCNELCSSRGIGLKVVRVNLAGAADTGIEASARAARYDALLRGAPDCIVLAHHLSDQAETILLQLLRGSGAKGLAAMTALKRDDGGRVVRPMLGEPCAQIQAHAEMRGLSWVTDESNADTRFSRNFIRHKIFPLLEGRFPGATRAMARSASHIAEAQRLMDDLAAIDIAPIRGSGGLNVMRLASLDDVRAKNVLRFHFTQHQLVLPQSVHIEELLRQIRSARGDSSLAINLGAMVARCHKGMLLLEKISPQLDPLGEHQWAGESIWPLPELGGVFAVNTVSGQGISLRRLRSAPVVVRLRAGGETLRLDASRPTRTLKNLLREAGIPYWRRRCLPLVYCGDELVFVPGIGVALSYVAGVNEDGVVMEWSET